MMMIMLGTSLRLATRATGTCLQSKAGRVGFSVRHASDFATDKDFAHRKEKISQLSFDEQDLTYYPTMEQGLKRLGCNEESVNTSGEPLGPLRLRVPEFRAIYEPKFKNDPSLHRLDEQTILGGKITSIRRAGKGSMFIDLAQDYKKVQLMVNHKAMGLEKDEFAQIHSQLKPGDQVLAVGNPSTTRVGELSLRLIRPVVLMSPALHTVPEKFIDTSMINQNRVVDYLANDRSKQIILARSRVISLVRQFLEARGFVEVVTPLLGSGNTGANALPFTTSSAHIKRKDKPVELSLRVAPELWLKRLIIGGFDKIYEIGPSFRNEGIDGTHNPEFTTCEFYRTFTSLEELMDLTEHLLLWILRDLSRDDTPFAEVCSKTCQRILSSVGETTASKEVQGGFGRIDFVTELERQTNTKLPEEITASSLIEYHREVGAPLPETLSESQLLDNLSSLFVEPQCDAARVGSRPMFIYNIPELVSPLAKSQHSGTGLVPARRFELYVNGKELANAYEEENNPFKQVSKFRNQLSQREAHLDLETITPDYGYSKFMEWGMPPTGGWGMGIDRLVMMVTGAERIDQVLSFGRLPDVLKQ